jgi:hypothetical protein
MTPVFVTRHAATDFLVLAQSATAKRLPATSIVGLVLLQARLSVIS